MVGIHFYTKFTDGYHSIGGSLTPLVIVHGACSSCSAALIISIDKFLCGRFMTMPDYICM